MSFYWIERETRHPDFIQKFGKLVAAGIASQAPLFLATFSSCGPGISDPRLLNYIFSFVPVVEFPSDLSAWQTANYHFCHPLWYRILKLNTRTDTIEFSSGRKRRVIDIFMQDYCLSRREKCEYLDAMVRFIPVWCISPDLFLEIFDIIYNYKCAKGHTEHQEDLANKILYGIARAAPTKEYADQFLEKYCGHFGQKTETGEIVLDSVIQEEFQMGEFNVARGNSFERIPERPISTYFNPEIELYVHQKLLHDQKYGELYKNEKTDRYSHLLSSLIDYVSMHWQRHATHSMDGLKALVKTFHITNESKIYRLVDRLLQTGNEEHALFWANLGVKDAASEFRIHKSYYSIPFWLALRKLKLSDPDGNQTTT